MKTHLGDTLIEFDLTMFRYGFVSIDWAPDPMWRSREAEVAKARLKAGNLQHLRPRKRQGIGSFPSRLHAAVLSKAADLSAALHALVAPGPSRAVRRSWTEQLESMGQLEVRDRLDAVAMLNTGRADKVHFVDAGLTHGVHRFPTRGFVEAWLGDGPRDDLRPLRILVLVALVFAGLAAGVQFDGLSGVL